MHSCCIEGRVGVCSRSAVCGCVTLMLPIRYLMQSLAVDFRSLGAELQKPYFLTAADMKDKVDSQRASLKARRVLSSYNLYLKSTYAACQAANPSAKLGELSKVIGSGWKKLSSEEKEVFSVKAAKLATSQSGLKNL